MGNYGEWLPDEESTSESCLPTTGVQRIKLDELLEFPMGKEVGRINADEGQVSRELSATVENVGQRSPSDHSGKKSDVLEMLSTIKFLSRFVAGRGAASMQGEERQRQKFNSRSRVPESKEKEQGRRLGFACDQQAVITCVHNLIRGDK